MAEHPEAGRRRDYLPFLTWTLLGLLVVWFLVWLLVYRPPRQERLRMAVFSRALETIPELYVKHVDEESLYRGAMKGMVESLGDRYSTYLTPEQMQRVGEETSGEFGGIGVVLNLINGRPLVQEVLEGGPAAAEDIKAGDFITQVDGVDVISLDIERVVSLVRGKPGSRVTLTLRRGSEEAPLTRTLTRQVIDLPSVEQSMLEDGIGVMHLSSFAKDAAGEFGRALLDLKSQGLKGLIVDLRDNAGGLVSQVTGICDMFLDQGLIVALAGRVNPAEPPVEATSQVLVDKTVPVVILVNHMTASAAEILAGALQAHGRATIVGTRTVGKGSVTSVIRLPDDSGLMITVSHYRLAGGRIIEGNGVEPDVVVGEVPQPPKGPITEAVRKQLVEEREKAFEAQMQRALEVMREKLAGQ
jgi:carboxyl-terminal processing protease